MKEKSKKIGLVGSVLMAIGCIIGSGLFGAFPTGIALCGTGIVWALVIALVRQFIMFVPNVAAGNVCPAPSANYTHGAKLVGPITGMIQALNGTLNITTIGLLATVFAIYANSLPIFSGIPVRFLSAGIVLVFTIAASFGSKSSEWVQNAIVVILLASLVMYIVKGFPAMSAENITVSQIIKPDASFKSLLSGAAIMGSCMSGGEILMNFMSEIDKPKRTIPLAFTISTIVVAVICILIAIVTLGTYPYQELTNLSDAASTFLSSGALTFFVIGGACFACMSTVNSVLISSAHVVNAAAEEKILPTFFTKHTKKGNAPIVSIWVLGLGSMLMCLLNLDVFTYMTAFTPLTLVITLLRFVPPFVISRKYPHSFKRNFFKLSKPLMDIITIAALVLTLAMQGSLISDLTLKNNLIMGGLLLVILLYCVIRIVYLKKKGYDLMSEMKKPYEPWEEAEREYAAEDAAAEKAA